MPQITFNNITQTRRNPIKRNNFLYDDLSLEFDEQLGMDYITQDMHQEIVLYRVDYNKTNQDQLYGETKTDGVKFLPPIEVPCVYEIEEAELRAYEKGKNLGTYQKTGKLKVGVYNKHLEELGVDINIGDYIGIQVNEKHMEYWVVNNDGKNNYDNQHTTFGKISTYRSITCTPVDPSEFNS